MPPSATYAALIFRDFTGSHRPRQALSDLIKAITCLPTDVTLLSLTPGPLLDIVCIAAQRQLTSVWLSLGQMLIIQLDPPSLLPTTFKSVPSSEARPVVLHIVGILLQTSLRLFGQPGMMINVSNPRAQFFGGCSLRFEMSRIPTLFSLSSNAWRLYAIDIDYAPIMI